MSSFYVTKRQCDTCSDNVNIPENAPYLRVEQNIPCPGGLIETRMIDLCVHCATALGLIRLLDTHAEASRERSQRGSA